MAEDRICVGAVAGAYGVGGEVRFCDKPAAWRIRAVEEAPSGLLLDRDGSLIV